MYPDLQVSNNEHPNRLWAIPIFGYLGKLVILIPVMIEIVLVNILIYFLLIINSFSVLFTGKYLPYAHQLILGSSRLTIKMNFFLWGITDKYPGFDFQIDDKFSLDIAYPASPNRVYAIPFLGFLIRMILIIPFSVFFYVISQAAALGVSYVASMVVLFTGRYPEFVFELLRDQTRLMLAMWVYGAGLSDKYPSFKISWNHKTAKIILIVICIVLFIGGLFVPDQPSQSEITLPKTTQLD